MSWSSSFSFSFAGSVAFSAGSLPLAGFALAGLLGSGEKFHPFSFSEAGIFSGCVDATLGLLLVATAEGATESAGFWVKLGECDLG